MRISTALALAVCAPVLLVVTSCGDDGEEIDTPARRSPLLVGTVTDKDYEPAVYKPKKVAITENKCKTKNGKTTCTKVSTGKTKTVQEKVYDECWELEIATPDGESVDICDINAYKALDVDDPYNSNTDYGRTAF